MTVVVIGGGVVGSAVTLALARRGVEVVLLEAEPELGMAASGTNSGILHTGFDSPPGELETAMILQSVRLRAPVLAALGVDVKRCGARMADAPAEYPYNDVAGRRLPNGDLEIWGEWVVDPIAYVRALGAAATAAGAEVRTQARVVAIEPAFTVYEASGARHRATTVINCAGLHADAIAAMVGDTSFSIYPRKGEFLVFDVPPPARILLPSPTPRTKGVLVFPTIDGQTVVGPTAIDGEDKNDWSVRPQARDELMAKAVAMHPPLEGAEPVFSYAGLRPAGRDGVNYLIDWARQGVMNVAAIRSTGLSASLGIAEYVAEVIAPDREQAPIAPWWRRVADFRAP
jgi:glycerol-3-phosphate dehydrogenase